ncbi:MAG: LTA synthase family protein [Hyphomicrobiales bacterium]
MRFNLKGILDKIPKNIRYIVNVYIIGIIFFSVFRLILLISNWNLSEQLPDNKWRLLIKAMFMGWRFDTVISGYILLLPFVILTLFFFIGKGYNKVQKLIGLYVAIMYGLAFMICSVDIPYFTYFFSRLTTSIFIWADDFTFGMKMIFSEVKYWIFILPLIILYIVFIKLIAKARKKTSKRNVFSQNWISSTIISIVFFGLMFLGIRGRVEKKSPIMVGTAYFSSYAFPNQLGLNPVFTFLRSYLDDKKKENQHPHLLDSDTAIKYVKEELNSTDRASLSIARNVIHDKVQDKNVVFIIMESMSAAKMGHFGNIDDLTPFLDSLANVSYSFENFYTSGIHTYNGVYSTLFSYPAIFKIHPMKTLPMGSYSGIAKVLQNGGYHTCYFTTHDDQFDNIGGFVHANGFDEVVSEKNYLQEKVLSTLGVPDHEMFKFAIPKLNSLYKEKKPFFTAFMTASDHGPYKIPKDIKFTPHSEGIRKQIVEYADWSLRQFFQQASKQEWFDNTIFVLVADHGYSGNSVYDMSLNYHHSPFIIYAPNDTTLVGKSDKLAIQPDVGITTLGLLGRSYVNNTLGVDLMREQRRFAYFCADDKLGCINDSLYYVWRSTGKKSLYKYRDKDTKDYQSDYPELTEEMELYVKSMTQVASDLIQHQKTEFVELHK